MLFLPSRVEVVALAETQQNVFADLARQARERLSQELLAGGELLGRLEQSLQELRERHRQVESAMNEQLDALEKFELPAPPPPPAPPAAGDSLEKVLGGVRNLITATLPEQVLETLTEEAQELGVRAAVFDVRGKAAWGSSARGFGQQLSEQALRSLVVPLNQAGPFRQVYETGGHVDANAGMLKRNRNVLDKLRPGADAPILLLPVRSAGSVSAIFYGDPGEQGTPLPVDALKILAEFAGAQLDRLMALSGVMPAPAEEPAEVEPDEAEAEVEAASPAAVEEVAPVEAVEEPVTPAVEEPPSSEPTQEPFEAAVTAAVASASEEVVAEPAQEEPVAVEAAPAAEVETPVVEAPPPPPPPPTPAGFDLSQLSEADQKIHKDARRFAKLLVSEIELYNKTKVADGRKSSDLYKRLKTDIDRSRQTYEKRFGKTVAKQHDYFHDELVKTLAGNDAALLGSEYPGPSV
jgi:hypothetical protein